MQRGKAEEKVACSTPKTSWQKRRQDTSVHAHGQNFQLGKGTFRGKIEKGIFAEEPFKL